MLLPRLRLASVNNTSQDKEEVKNTHFKLSPKQFVHVVKYKDARTVPQCLFEPVLKLCPQGRDRLVCPSS